MSKKKINRVKLEGDNNFIFQYIDAEGRASEERKSMRDFLQPFVEPHLKQIALLEKSLADKQKIEGLLDKEVLELSAQLQTLESEKEEVEKQAANLLKELEGKDLSQNSSLYQEAFALFTAAKIDEALEVLDEAKLEEEERKMLEALKSQAETRILRAQMLRLKHKYKEA